MVYSVFESGGIWEEQRERFPKQVGPKFWSWRGRHTVTNPGEAWLGDKGMELGESVHARTTDNTKAAANCPQHQVNVLRRHWVISEIILYSMELLTSRYLKNIELSSFTVFCLWSLNIKQYRDNMHLNVLFQLIFYKKYFITLAGWTWWWQCPLTYIICVISQILDTLPRKKGREEENWPLLYFSSNVTVFSLFLVADMSEHLPPLLCYYSWTPQTSWFTRGIYFVHGAGAGKPNTKLLPSGDGLVAAW